MIVQWYRSSILKCRRRYWWTTTIYEGL